jgi:hypothetical protein
MTATQLTRTDAATLLPAIPRNAPVEAMLRLPAWLDLLVHSVSRTEEGAPTWSREPKIPASLMPTGPQRAAIDARIAQLDRMAVPGPQDRALAAITKLVMFYATSGLSEDQAAIRGAVFLEALDDMPAWAIEEAVRRWFKGKAGEQRYDFAPSPAALRAITEDIAKIAAGQRVVMRRILAAEPLAPPVSDDVKAKHAAEAQALIAQISGKEPPPRSLPAEETAP